MQSFNEPAEAQAALRAYLRNPETLTDEFMDKLIAASEERSPVVGSGNLVNLVYARTEEAPEQLKELAAATALMMSNHGFHGMDELSKGSRMAEVLRGNEVEDPPQPDPIFAPVTVPHEPAIEVPPVDEDKN